MDLDVFSVTLRVVGIDFIQSSLCPKDSDSGNPAAYPSNEEHYRGEYCKQISQDINQKSESDQQQPYDKKSGCEVSGCLGNDVRVETKTHI